MLVYRCDLDCLGSSVLSFPAKYPHVLATRQSLPTNHRMRWLLQGNTVSHPIVPLLFCSDLSVRCQLIVVHLSLSLYVAIYSHSLKCSPLGSVRLADLMRGTIPDVKILYILKNDSRPEYFRGLIPQEVNGPLGIFQWLQNFMLLGAF